MTLSFVPLIAVPLRTPGRHDVSTCMYSVPVLGTPRRVVTHPSMSVQRRPIASRIASAALKLLIQSLCSVADDVDIDINATSNLALLSGHLNAVTIKASTLVYKGVSISGGTALYTDEIQLAYPQPTAGTIFTASPPRLAKPFSVSVRATLTEADLNRRGPLRDALQTLLSQIVTTALSGAVGRALPDTIGGISCTLDYVRLTDGVPRGNSDKTSWLARIPFWPFGRQNLRGAVGQPDDGCLELHAHAKLASGRVFTFSVRTGVEAVEEGSIVKLREPYLVWNELNVPLVTIDTIGVKLWSTTSVTKVRIGQGRLSADGITVISPPPIPSRQLSGTSGGIAS